GPFRLRRRRHPSLGNLLGSYAEFVGRPSFLYCVGYIPTERRLASAAVGSATGECDDVDDPDGGHAEPMEPLRQLFGVSPSCWVRIWPNQSLLHLSKRRQVCLGDRMGAAGRGGHK